MLACVVHFVLSSKYCQVDSVHLYAGISRNNMIPKYYHAKYSLQSKRHPQFPIVVWQNLYSVETSIVPVSTWLLPVPVPNLIEDVLFFQVALLFLGFWHLKLLLVLSHRMSFQPEINAQQYILFRHTQICEITQKSEFPVKFVNHFLHEITTSL